VFIFSYLVVFGLGMAALPSARILVRVRNWFRRWILRRREYQRVNQQFDLVFKTGLAQYMQTIPPGAILSTDQQNELFGYLAAHRTKLQETLKQVEVTLGKPI
jgi:hypothetical protein